MCSSQIIFKVPFFPANFNDEVVGKLPVEVTTGIYFGWSKLASEQVVRKAVISIGWNPYYHNVKKSVVSCFDQT